MPCMCSSFPSGMKVKYSQSAIESKEAKKKKVRQEEYALGNF